MISPYVRPQDTITQILQQTAVRATSRRNPIVIGPQYNLYLNDGRDLSGAYVDFLAAGEDSLPYEDGNGVALNLAKLKPKTDSAQLYGSGLQALVAQFDSGTWDMDEDDAALRSIRIGANNVAGGGTLNSGLDGRDVRIGDIISTSWSASGTGTSRRRVVGLLGVVTEADYDDTAIGVLNPTEQGAAAAVAVAAGTTSGITVDAVPVIDADDIPMLRAAGKVVRVEGDYKLSDTLDIVCVTGGDSDNATFNVTSLVTGTTTLIASVDVNAGDFEISLADIDGYSGTSAVVLAKATDMVTDDKIRVTLQTVFSPRATSDMTVSGTYTGKVNRRYAIEVIVAGASDIDVNVYDVTGVDPSVQYTNALAAGSLDLGTSGLVFNPAGAIAGYAKGQIFYVDAVAATTSTSQFDGLVLDGPPVPSLNVTNAGGAGSVTLTDVSVFQEYSGLLDDTNTDGIEDALVAGAESWEFASGLGLSNTAAGRTSGDFSPFADTYGFIFLSYKALVIPAATETVIEINRAVDIVPNVGEVDYENWLGQGTSEAFRGNQNRVVYALRTGGDTVEDFTTALRKIKTTDRVYALAIMTDDVDVMELVRDHCVLMSNKFNKNFRRAYVGTDSPGAYVHWGVITGSEYRTGSLSSSIVTLDEAYRATSKFVAADVGSTITLQAIGMTYNILEWLSDFEVLTDAPEEDIAPDSNLILTRSDTPANTAAYVAARSAALGSRRLVNVWCDDPTVVAADGSTKVVPMKFVAAEIAGLRCALLPQQGLTMTEVLSVTAAASMFTTFEADELDNVAANGTFVVTQESEGGEVFIRHQLTTSTDEGALAYEDNVGVIVDDFSYAVKDQFRSYIGRRNATPDTIAEIDDKLKALATTYTQVDLINSDIGPPILAFFDEDGKEGEVTVRQDGVLADTLMTYTKLRVPLPLNGINHYIDVEVSELLASEDN